jgi:putative lipoic acid-binding regulatory protein
MDTPQKTPLFSCNEKPEIVYPCRWSYKVIGKNPDLLQQAIVSSCMGVSVTITPSHASSRGTYISLNAELTVENEKMRLLIYQALTQHPDVKLVL